MRKHLPLLLSITLWIIASMLWMDLERRAALLALFGARAPASAVSTDELAVRTLDALLKFNGLLSESCREESSAVPPLLNWLKTQAAVSSAGGIGISRSPALPALIAGRRNSLKRQDASEVYRLPECLFSAIASLNAFFSRNQSIHKSLISAERLKKALQNEASITAINSLIDQDQLLQNSELGGVATLSYPPGSPPLLNFHPLPSALEETSASLRALREDPERALSFILEQQRTFLLLKDQTEVFLREIQKLTDPEKRANRIHLYIDSWLMMTRLSYIFSDYALSSQAARIRIEGVYLGLFHLHPPRNTPSWEDQLEGYWKRNIVIIPQAGGFDFVYFSRQGDDGSEQLFKVRENRLLIEQGL